MNYKHDQMMEKEREIFSNRVKEMSLNQERELAAMRNRWSQEIADERSRLESYYIEEIKLWKNKCQIP